MKRREFLKASGAGLASTTVFGLSGLITSCSSDSEDSPAVDPGVNPGVNPSVINIDLTAEGTTKSLARVQPFGQRGLSRSIIIQLL